MIDERDYKILVQNLLNRATDVEIHNAVIGNRAVDFKNITDNLDGFKTIVRNELMAFGKPKSTAKPAGKHPY